MSDQKRENFRIEYPTSYRPTFTVGGIAHPVINLSERGMLFALTQKFRPELNQKLQGILRFADGKEIPIAGQVLRLFAAKDHCVLVMTRGVPLPKMMEEQRLILQKFQK